MVHSFRDSRALPRATHRRLSQPTLSLLAPTNLELAGLLGLIGFYTFAESILGRGSETTVNFVGPCLLMLSLAWGVWVMVSADSRSVLTPLFMFRAATIINFGLGSMVDFFISDAKRLILAGLYASSDTELIRLNQLVATSMFVLLLTCRVLEIGNWRLRQRLAALGPSSFGLEQMRTFGLAFAVGGYAIKYLVVFPISMGWVPDILPGIVGTLSQTSLLGIYLLTYWSLAARPSLTPVIVIMVLMDSALGLVLLSKAEALFPLLIFFLALVVHKATPLRIGISVFALFFGLGQLMPLVAYGRDQLWERSAGTGALSLADRISILLSYANSTGAQTQDIDSSDFIMRLSYVNAGTLAMNLFDSGNPGNSLSEWYIILVPRFLWPDKPIIQPGKEFSRVATMRDAENSVSPGTFAEAYWNFGWSGVPIIMIPIGVLMLLLSRYVMYVLTREQWIYLPTAFLCTKMGMESAGWIVAGFLGTLVIIIAMHILTFIAMDLLVRLGLVLPEAAMARARRSIEPQ